MRLRQLCLSVLFCLGLTTLEAQTIPAPPAPAEEELVGPIKLPDADIDTVLGLLEIYTGRIILRPQQLPSANYHLVIDRRIPKSEAVLALETVLALNQVGVTPLGEKFLKVVALAQLKTEAPEMIDGPTLGLPPSGRIAAKLFQLDFLRVNEFVPLIAPLMSPGVANGVVPLEKSNAVLITDSISNLQRVELLLQKLDAPATAGLTPKFYTLREAKASDVVNKLRTMFQGPLQSQLGSATSYSADDRTNQIVLLSDPRQQRIFDDLIARLDVKAEPNTRNEVIYLKHASAKDVAPLLSQLVSGQNQAAQRASGNATRNPQVLQQPAGDGAAESAGEAAVAGLAESNEFSSLITILPDERSNAVVVSGTVDDIRLLRGLIDKIDILLAQVRIEVVIAEVTLSDNDKSGLAKLNLTFGQDGGVTRITRFDGIIQGVTVSNGVTNPLSFVASLGDNGDRNDVRVLSSPTIVTTHNKEAQILVGEKRPLITGTQSSIVTAGATPVTSSTVSYTDIAIDLKVTPLIGEDGSIQLKIDQKVDDITGNVVIDNNQQPIIGRRQATSFVNVKDSEMIVLGGLQRNRVSNNRTKLGFFYELPIISHIFGARTKGLERTELLLFIRPHVIRPADGTADTMRKIDELSNRQQINQYLIDPSKQPEKPGSEKADEKKTD